MEVDKTTKISFFNIVIDDKKEYLEKLREQANDDDQNNDDVDQKKLSLRDEGHTNNTEEIYFENGKIYYSGYLTSKEGDSYVCFELPLSQVILFDILSDSIKKFNKIKTVLEATKD